MWNRFFKSTQSKDVTNDVPKTQQLPSYTPETLLASVMQGVAAGDLAQAVARLTRHASCGSAGANAGATDVTSTHPPADVTPTPPGDVTPLVHIQPSTAGLSLLGQLVRQKLEALQRQEDHVAVCNACRILDLVQSWQSGSPSDEGLDIYLDYLEKWIHKDATEYMKLLVEEMDTTTSASVLADLFSLAGSIIHDSSPLVAPFASDATHKLVSRVHNQCSIHVTNIFELFSEELNLADVVQQLHDVRLSEDPASLIANPLQQDETLQTISLMCAYAARYLLFIQNKDSSVDCNKLQVCVQVMLGHYLALESFYLEHTMKEAIAIQQEMMVSAADRDVAASEEAVSGLGLSPKQGGKSNKDRKDFKECKDPRDNITNHEPNVAPTERDPSSSAYTTLVDDTFFIIKKSMKRGMSTLATPIAMALINTVATTLEAPFLHTLHALAELFRQPRYHVATHDMFLEVLNDLELAAEYLTQLQRDMDGDIDKVFTIANEKTKLHACLDDTIKTAVHSCQRMRKKNLEIYGAKLTITLESVFATLFRPVSYEMDESMYEQAEINDPFMLRLIDIIQAQLQHSLALRPQSRADLARCVATFIASKFETALPTKRFTSLGAVQFSKEVRMLGDYFVSVGGQPLRYQFTKLAQISQLLNLDRVIDCMEYWIEGKSVFKLSIEEVKQVLLRRVDFSPESINALKL